VCLLYGFSNSLLISDFFVKLLLRLFLGPAAGPKFSLPTGNFA
jgi:hypothetical protein